MKGDFQDNASLLHLSIAMGVGNYDDRFYTPIEEGEKILSSYRLTRVIHILTRVIYMDDGSDLYG